jgi:hypothetical protein
LTTSGVVVQNEDGSLVAVAPDEAEKRLAAMNRERRAMYEDDSEALEDGSQKTASHA